MATIDLRTYVLLERSFARRLQRSWAVYSAPIYAKITQACLDHQWDEARRLVGDLDMTEVGTQQREWITYMLLSCAVFGASVVAKRKPSFVGVGTFDTFLKQTTNNMLQYLEYTGTSQVQEAARQLIAEDEAKTKALPKVAFDESEHPRHPSGTAEGGEFAPREGFRPMTSGEAAKHTHLVVPPAWVQVQVAIDPKADLQVVGKDVKGRTQYLYSKEHDKRQAAERFARAKEFAKVLPDLRAKILPDLQSDDPEIRDAASELYLMDKSAFRIGGSKTKGDVKAYGITTLLGKHVRVLDGDRVSFNFIGKHGVNIRKIIHDPILHRMMQERKKGSYERLFTTSAEGLRDYMETKVQGFHPKDFRTHQGTSIAMLEVEKRKVVKTDKEFKKVQRDVAKVVAKHLGNTPAVAIKNYIDPAVWDRLRVR